MRHPAPLRSAIAVLLFLPLLLAAPQPAAAQMAMPVIDAANVAQAILTYKRLKKQLEEHVRTANRLRTRTTQAITQISHLRDAANGRIAALSQAFSQLASRPARLFQNNSNLPWLRGLDPDSRRLAQALLQMDESSLVTYLQNELDAADVVTDTDLLALYPDSARGTALAEAWREGRETGERIRSTDYAVAEAAGHVLALVDDAQQRIADRRAQSQLSNTALQQAQVANQITAAEIDIAVAQFLAIQAQQEALQRQHHELLARERLDLWVQRERDRAAQLQQFLTAEQGRRAAARQWGRLPAN